MKQAALLAVALAAAGCSRDLDLPGATAFAVSASPTTVAPRQTSTITATGGSGALDFAFDAGGKLSGDDAAIVANGDGTATYTAGRNGSTQDTLTVTDGSGAVRRVIITVGPRLSLTPAVGSTAPGGSLTFVASGGKSPYAFSVSPTGTGASVTADPVDGTKAHYVAGTSGDTEETVTVSDGTGDPAASASAIVRVGTRLGLYRTSTGPVAPNEEVTLVAYGGRPPYVFGPAWDPALPEEGGFKDTTQGVFTVGAPDPLALPVEPSVTDQNGQTASVSLFVGPALTASLASAQVRPGVANRILPAGGKPPYEFRFAARGNHSYGEVGTYTGSYVPGPSPGARDRLEVVDATGTVAAVASVRPVGPIELGVGTDGDRCVGGDYDGDGVEDLAFLFRGMSLLEVNRAASPEAVYRSYYVGTGFQFPAVLSRDVDEDRRDELLFHGVTGGGPVRADGSEIPFWALEPDLSGLFGGITDFEYQLQPPMNGRHATVVRDDAAGQTLFVYDDLARCGGTMFPTVIWTDGPGATMPANPILNCFVAATIESPELLGGAVALQAADYDGNGQWDVAWLPAAMTADSIYANTWNTEGPIHVRFRSGGTFVAGASLSFPAIPRLDFEGQGNGEQNRFLKVPPRPGATAEGLLIRLRDLSNGRGVLAFASGQPLVWRYVGYDPFGGIGAGATALFLFTPAPGASPLVAAVRGNDGEVRVFDPWAFSGTTPPAAAKVADVDFPATYGCSVDADADGFPDIAVGGDGSDLARLLWGDGAGGFGTRPRLAGAGFVGGSGDLDGDGLADLVASDGVGLKILYGDAGQLGWGETSLTGALVAAAATAAFFDPGVGPPPWPDGILYQTIDGDYFVLQADGNGGFLGPRSMAWGTGAEPIVPKIPHDWMQVADLGGGAYGPDLLAPHNDYYGNNWLHLILRPNDADVIEEHESRIVGDYRATGGGIVKTHQCAFAPVHAGTGYAVASLCAYEAVPGQPAAEWRVRGWPIDWALPGWYDEPWKDAGINGDDPGVPGTESAVAAIGELGGKAYFVVATDRIHLAAVDPRGNALDPAGWEVTTGALTTQRGMSPYGAGLADLDQDGALDAVVGGEGMTLVLRNSGTNDAPSFAAADVRLIPAAGFPVLAGPLDQGERPSVVLAGRSGLQLLRPDASGQLR